MNIGIFGGSFNPIHNGHIHVAHTALTQAHLDQVWMMVSPQNPLKTHEQLPYALRYHLTRIALHGDDTIHASAFEASMPTPSYTWHTLQALQQHYPQHVFSLIIGQDNWENFHKWYHWQDILTHHSVIVYPREQTNKQDNSSTQAPPVIQPVMLNAQMPVKILTGQFLPVSSTDIRQKIQRGENVSNLVPTIIQPFLTLLYR